MGVRAQQIIYAAARGGGPGFAAENAGRHQAEYREGRGFSFVFRTELC